MRITVQVFSGALVALGSLSACCVAIDGMLTPASDPLAEARHVIEQGDVPMGFLEPTALLADHDLRLGDACQDDVCLSAGAVDTTSIEGSAGRLLQTSVVVPAVPRPDLKLMLVVSQSEAHPSDIPAVREGLRNLVDQLGPNDEVGLIAFDHRAKVKLKPVAMDGEGKDKLLREIDGLEEVPEGGVNVYDALYKAYDLLEEPAGKQRWVAVLTDAPFGALNVVADHQRAVGATIFGVLGSLPQTTVVEAAAIRNVTTRNLTTVEEVANAFHDLRRQVTPVAYDLQLTLDARADVIEEFGALVHTQATLFGGDVLATGARVPEGAGGTASLAWTDRGGERHTLNMDVSNGLAPLKMAALLDEMDALGAAGSMCGGGATLAEAEALVDEAASRLHGLAGASKDADLLVEAALMDQLLVNLVDGDCVSVN